MGFKILIVDDEPDVELLIKQRFRRKIRDGEFEFAFALNGQEALDKLHEDHSIDIVMSDINMPVMDGLTLLSRLTDLDRVLRTVIVSAYGDMQNLRLAMNRGAYDFLTKPIDFEDFETTVYKTIQEIKGIKEGYQARQQLNAIQNELSVASRIQQSILPRTFPAFPERSDFEIYAEMNAARSVGGDFYDFFLIDPTHLGFVIGDVSGKGVPAAIFMAVSRTLLRATAMQGVSAATCLDYVNRVLVKQSETSMFVTVFYAILNTATGEVDYCIAGHNPPYVFSARGIEAIHEPRAMVAGLFEQTAYSGGTLRLEKGDGILLYTDGVTEATDAQDNEYSEERLEKTLTALKEGTTQQIIEGLLTDLRGFTGAAPQSDDITALALRYLG
jgi:phosphoserine phosphatase RsbU/P